MQNYVRDSLELHLFFARIMKEHSLCEAQWYKGELEKLLSDTVRLSNCMICPDVLNSGEIVTQYTFGAERKTSELTGIVIDTNITLQQLRLQPMNNSYLATIGWIN